METSHRSSYCTTALANFLRTVCPFSKPLRSAGLPWLSTLMTKMARNYPFCSSCVYQILCRRFSLFHHRWGPATVVTVLFRGGAHFLCCLRKVFSANEPEGLKEPTRTYRSVHGVAFAFMVAFAVYLCFTYYLCSLPLLRVTVSSRRNLHYLTEFLFAFI